MKKRAVAIMISLAMALSMTACGFSDGVQDGIDAAQSEEQETSEPEETPEETKEPEETETPEPEQDVSENPLMSAELKVDDVMNGSKTEKLGEYAVVTVPLETMKGVTMEQYDEFCDQVVRDSGYNWVTIDFGDGTGLQFAGSTPAIATYGTLDEEGCIVESAGSVMMTDGDTYEYTPNE